MRSVSQINLEIGFHQVEVNEPDREKLAFSIHGRKFEYKRMPFGIKNASFTFQKIMTTILGHLNDVKIYKDDFLVYSEDEGTHLIHLKEVLATFDENNVKVNLDKNKFIAEEVEFFGQIVNADGVR